MNEINAINAIDAINVFICINVFMCINAIQVSLYTGHRDKTFTGHCTHISVLSSHTGVSARTEPHSPPLSSQLGSHKGRDPEIRYPTYTAKSPPPPGCPPNRLTYDKRARCAERCEELRSSAERSEEL